MTSCLLTYRNERKEKGFSLVELAIVLVIIGLIISSVLVGQDIIRAAELRSISKQMTDFKTAVQTFATRFDNALPGDIQSANATGFGIDVTDCDGGEGEGDGDGLIESAGVAGGRVTFDGEVSCFWAQLSEQNMVQGTYDGYDDAGATANDILGLNMPEVRSRASGWGAYTNGVDNFLVAGVTGGEDDDDYHTVATFRPQDARDIDKKLDDGLPLTGIVLGRDPFATDSDGDPHFVETDPDNDSSCFNVNAANIGANVDNTDDTYLGTIDTLQCVLSFQLPRI